MIIGHVCNIAMFINETNKFHSVNKCYHLFVSVIADETGGNEQDAENVNKSRRLLGKTRRKVASAIRLAALREAADIADATPIDHGTNDIKNCRIKQSSFKFCN